MMVGNNERKIFEYPMTRICMRISGVWNSKTTSKAGLMFSMLNIIYYNLMNFVPFFRFELKDLFLELGMCFFSVQLLLKNAFCQLRRSSLERLVARLQESSDRPQFAGLTRVANQLYTLIIVLYCVGIVYVSAALLARCHLSGECTKVIGNVYSPIDPQEYFHLAVIVEFANFLLCGTFAVSHTILLVTSTLRTNRELSILRELLQSLGRHLDDQTFQSTIRRFIELHVKTIRLIEDVNHVITPGLIGEMVVTSISVAGTLSSGVGSEKEADGFLLSIIVIIMAFIPCYCGQRIEDESNELRTCLYSVGWEDWTPWRRKQILTLFIVSQRPLNLRLSNKIILSFVQFSAFMQTSYSFITLLINVKS